MKRKIALTTIIISAFLILLVAGMQVVEVAKANPYLFYERVSPIPGSSPPQITIISPQDNTVYITNTTISFNVSTPITPQGSCKTAHISCTLDNKTELYCNNSEITQQFSFSQNFNLTEGNHSLTVYSVALFFPGGMTIFELSNTSKVSFAVDATSPNISKLSLENKTYSSNTIPLDFNVNETPSWSGYSLDNQDNITIAGNATLTGLSDGSHSLAVYANDTAGNIGKSDTVFFTIINPTPSPNLTPSGSPTQTPTLEPSPTLDNIQAENFTPIAIIVGLVIAVAIVGLLVYFAKHKGEK